MSTQAPAPYEAQTKSVDEVPPDTRRGGDVRTLLSPKTVGCSTGFMGVATIGPGAIVGEVAFFLDRPRTASVVVESPMTAWRFSRASLARLQKEMPDLAFRFHQGIAGMMARRLASTNRLVTFLAD